MSDFRNCTREFLTEFIDIYRQEECLWKIKCKDYSNRDKKAVSYYRLVEKMREVDPDAERETVVKKINNLRSAFRKELKKQSESLTYTPRLWYFNMLSFLVDQEASMHNAPNSSGIEDCAQYLDIEATDPLSIEDELRHHYQSLCARMKDGRESLPMDKIDFAARIKLEARTHPEGHHAIPEPKIQEVKVREPSEAIPESPEDLQVSSPASAEQQPIHFPYQGPDNYPRGYGSMPLQITSSHQSKAKKCKPDPTDALIGLVYHRLQSAKSEDAHDIVGKNVASKLRVVSKDQRIYAERLINEVLFEAEMGNLNRECRLVTSQCKM